MRTPKLLVALLAIGMAVTGCSSTSPSQPLPAANTPAETETPTPTPTPGVVAHIKDDQGYTFDVSYLYRQQVLTKDISAEAPGFNSIRIPMSASWTITNTTAGRDITFKSVSGLIAPLSDPTLTLVGLWPSTSDVCTYAAQPTSTRTGGTCSIVLISTQLPNTLSASQTVTPTTYAGYLNADAGVRQVPDAKYNAVLAELDSPASFSIRYNAGDTVRFKDNCPDADLTSYLAQGMGANVNYFNVGFLPIFSTTGSCSASVGVSQPPAQ